MALRRNKPREEPNPPAESAAARDPFAEHVDVPPSEDAAAPGEFCELGSKSRPDHGPVARIEALSKAIEALWEELRADPWWFSQRMVEAQDPSVVAELASFLKRGRRALHSMARAQLWIADEDRQKLRAIAIRNATTELPGREMPPSAIEALESREPLELSDDRDEIEPLELLDARDETTRALLERDRGEWRELLLEAFYQPRPSITPRSIATVARRQGLALAVASVLDPLLEHELFLRLCVAHALARLTADFRAIAIALQAAVVLTDSPSEHFRFPPTDVAAPIRALLASKPLAVIPHLVAFLPRVQDSTLRGDVLNALERLILNGFAAPDGDPAEVRALTFSLLGELLKYDTVEKSLVEQVAQIVRTQTRAKILGEGFDAVIKELAVASGVAVERIGWAIWREPLTSPNEAELRRVDPDAALWAIRNLSGEEGPPWTWRVYDHIARFLLQPEYREYRIKAIRRLGDYGPTSNRDPLPDDVKDLRNSLEFLKKDKDPEVLREAEAALDRNRARGEEVASARLPIHPPLTLFPSPGETSPVPRMEATQEVSPGPTAAPPPDLDLAATDFGGSAALAQGVRAITQHAADPASIAGLKAFVTFLSSNIEPVVEMFRQPLLRYSHEWPDLIPTLVRILDRLRAKLVAMSSVSINEPAPAAGAGGNDHGPKLSAGSGELMRYGVAEKREAASAANQKVGEAATIEETIELMLSTYYTPMKAADRLELSDRTVREHCESGTIRAIQVGRDWYISPQALEEFASNRPRRGPKPKSGSTL